jgi:outer membrane protein assembly factor BamB
VAQVAGRPQLLIPGHETIVSYDPATGREIWRCRWKAVNAASTAAFDDRHVYVSTTERDALVVCIRADGAGDVSDSHVVWQQSQGASYVPSPLVFGGHLYLVGDKGVVTCLDAGAGRQAWKKRLGGDFSASPVAAGGVLYATNETGKTYVLRPGEKPEVLAENLVPEGMLATPVCCGGEVFLRTTQSLICISMRPPIGAKAAETSSKQE